ncbi:MAG: biotin synthase BioB [Candidatus Omnitrophica bacterium]|nr:biotin synthase BioB [Candidatus Omnitrophota bacterium]
MNRKEMNSLLKLPLPELLSLANKTRKDYLGSKFELCSIVNAKSGHCSEDCKFCAQSTHHSTKIVTYPLRKNKEILEAARRAKSIGAKKFGIVTSGNYLKTREIEEIALVISQIKKKVGIAVCASLGALGREELKELKQAGLLRYHHNIETSPRFYKQIVSTHDFRERVDTIKTAKSSGLEVCSGGIIGMGEEWRDRIDMAVLLKELDVDSVPINILVPIKGTTLEALEPIACCDIIRTICIFRMILKDKIIKIVAGRESVLRDFQGLGFMGGANGMLIGGYLTIEGRDVAADYKLIEEIKKLWNE